MRQNPTPSEAKLWQELRGKRLGVAFRRQVVIGRFIVDFLAPSLKLVVEVDGGVHRNRRARDRRRDEELRRLGYRVGRVTVDYGMMDLQSAVRKAL
jgi:very-short-patch-repair endonuclease